MKSVSLCHECVFDQDDTGKIKYKGPSPDEEALLEFALDLNFVFKGSNDQNIRIT